MITSFSSPAPFRRLSGLATALLCCLALPARAQSASPEAELWSQTQQASRAASSNGRATGSVGTLATLPARLADALLVPKASVGPLKGASPTKLGSTASLAYATDSAAVDTLLGSLAKEFPNGKAGLCVGAGDFTRQAKLPAGAIEAIAGTFGMRPEDGQPVTVWEVSLGGRTAPLTKQTAGEALYELLRRRGTSSKPMDVGVYPPLEEVPTRLTLTTVDGKKLTLPVELEGASSQLKLAPDSTWLLPGGASVRVDLSLPLHRLLMERVLVDGAARLDRVESRVLQRSWSGAVPRSTARTVELHVVGAANRWFGKSRATLGANAQIVREREGCALTITVEPTVTAVELPEMPLFAWKAVTGVTIVDPSAKSVVLGFLDGPAAETHQGRLTWREFDDALAKTPRCAALCNGASDYLTGKFEKEKALFDAMQAAGLVSADATPPVAPFFDTALCQRSCGVSSEYENCVRSSQNDAAALRSCQSRAP